MNTRELKEYVKTLKTSVPGKFFFYCLPFRRKVVLENLRHVFSETLTPDEIKKLAIAFYSHMLKAVRENLWLKFQSEEAIKNKVKIIGAEHAINAGEQGAKGIAILAGHFGNWELAPIGGILNFDQFKGRFHVIRKTLKNKWIERILFHRYNRVGINVIPKKNSLNQVCDALESNDAVIFIMDQHASVSVKDGISVEFFGKPAGTYRSLAKIVEYTGVKVVPMCCYREKDGTHVLEFLPPLAWEEGGDSKKGMYLNTRRYNEQLEKMVLAHPEQWLWMHRRWKI